MLEIYDSNIEEIEDGDTIDNLIEEEDEIDTQSLIIPPAEKVGE